MLARRIGRDDSLAAALGEPVSELGGIVGPVGDQAPRGGNALQEGRRADQIVGLAGGESEGKGAAGGVGYGMNFGRPSAARSPDGVFEVPPFAPAAERWALTWVESTAVVLMMPLDPLRA